MPKLWPILKDHLSGGGLTLLCCLALVAASPTGSTQEPDPSGASEEPGAAFYDAFPYTPNPSASEHYRDLVRGKPARWAHHDPRPCLIPPDWSGGYTSIFAAQAGEESQAASG